MKRKLLKAICTLLILATALSLCSFLASCDNKDEDENNNEKDEYHIEFTDALDRKITLKKQPERVAALLGSFADVWVLSGGYLCAAAEDAWEDFGLEQKNAVSIGGAHSPSLELLLSASPDFVIASASTASNVEMKDALESIGITVAYFEVDNFEDYLHMLDICTDITGRKDMYEKNGTALKETIDGIKKSFAEADITDNERRILLLRASSTAVKAKGSKGTILGEMLSDIGCINIADNDSTLLESLSAEAVIKEDPHHIFVVTMGSDTDAANASLQNMIKENPAWSTLNAVKEGRLYVMDKTLFNLKPNSRWAEAYEILYEKLTKK